MPKKPQRNPKPKGNGGLGLEGQGGVVELELIQGIPQIRIFGAVLGVDAAENHGLGRPIAGEGGCRGTVGAGDGVTHLSVLYVLDRGGEPAHLTGGELLAGVHAQGAEIPAVQHLIAGTGGHHFDPHALFQRALHHPEIDDDAQIGVILAVKDQGFQGGVRVAGGGGDVLHDVLQHSGDVDPLLGGDLRRVQGGQADDVLHLVLGLLGVGGGEVDLVEHGQDLQVVLQGQIGVSQGLGLHTLGRVHHQHRALAGGQGPGHLIVEVHVARGVDQVQGIGPCRPPPCSPGGRPGALMVMPRSRSRSMLSSSWDSISRWGTASHSSMSRSDSVDFPWSMWAMMEKLRIKDRSVIKGNLLGKIHGPVEAGRVGRRGLYSDRISGPYFTG